MTFYLIAKGTKDEAVLKAILDLGEGTEGRYEGEWFLYSILARKAAEKAEWARRMKREKEVRELRKAARKAKIDGE